MVEVVGVVVMIKTKELKIRGKKKKERKNERK